MNVNDVLDSRYRIISKISSEGGGTVFRARDDRAAKTVTVKLVRKEVIDRIDIKKSTDVLRSVKHKNLPVVTDVVTDGSDTYTVMEFINGDSARNLHDSGTVYTEKEVCSFMIQLCDAADYLHKHDPAIIHGDINPDNVVITPEKDAVLVDLSFCLADAGSPGQLRMAVSTADKVADFHEKTRYIRPGGASAPGNTAFVDVKSDIFGLGATMYYLITGSVSADGKVDVDKHDFSLLVRKIIKKATSPDLDVRYESAARMRDDLIKAQRTARTDKLRQEHIKRQPAPAPKAPEKLAAPAKKTTPAAQPKKNEQKPAPKPAPQKAAKPVQQPKPQSTAEKPKSMKNVIIVAVVLICAVPLICILASKGKGNDTPAAVPSTSKSSQTKASDKDTDAPGDDEEEDIEEVEVGGEDTAWVNSDTNEEPAEMIVPDFYGKTLMEAVAAANQAGVPFSFIYSPNDVVDKGCVFQQSVKSGEILDPGHSVILYINAANEAAVPTEAPIETVTQAATTQPAVTTAPKVTTARPAATTVVRTTTAPAETEKKKQTTKVTKKKVTTVATTKKKKKKEETTTARKEVTTVGWTFAEEEEDMNGPIQRETEAPSGDGGGDHIVQGGID